MSSKSAKKVKSLADLGANLGIENAEASVADAKVKVIKRPSAKAKSVSAEPGPSAYLKGPHDEAFKEIGASIMEGLTSDMDLEVDEADSDTIGRILSEEMDGVEEPDEGELSEEDQRIIDDIEQNERLHGTLEQEGTIIYSNRAVEDFNPEFTVRVPRILEDLTATNVESVTEEVTDWAALMSDAIADNDGENVAIIDSLAMLTEGREEDMAFAASQFAKSQSADETGYDDILDMHYAKKKAEETLEHAIEDEARIEKMLAADVDTSAAPTLFGGMTHEQIMEELKAFVELIPSPKIKKTWDVMTTAQLYDLLTIMRGNNGGSLDMAKLIDKTSEEYEGYLQSPMMESRMKLVEQKAADQVKIITAMSKVLGKDLVVQGVRSQDYHDMLKSMVRYVVAFTSKINSIASQMGITIPEDSVFPTENHIPIVEGMPADPRIGMYVLNVFDANIERLLDHSRYVGETLTKAREEIEHLRKREKVMLQEVRTSKAIVENVQEEYQRFISASSYWIIKDTKNHILRKIDPSLPLQKPADLDLRGEIDTALFLVSEKAAIDLAERLMASRRFSKRTLVVHRVSIVPVAN